MMLFPTTTFVGKYVPKTAFNYNLEVNTKVKFMDSCLDFM